MRHLIEAVAKLSPDDGKDTIEMTVPLFIRCLEWARESAKTDIDLHKFVENITNQDRILDSDDYDDLFDGIKQGD